MEPSGNRFRYPNSMSGASRSTVVPSCPARSSGDTPAQGAAALVIAEAGGLNRVALEAAGAGAGFGDRLRSSPSTTALMGKLCDAPVVFAVMVVSCGCAAARSQNRVEQRIRLLQFQRWYLHLALLACLSSRLFHGLDCRENASIYAREKIFLIFYACKRRVIPKQI